MLAYKAEVSNVLRQNSDRKKVFREAVVESKWLHCVNREVDVFY